MDTLSLKVISSNKIFFQGKCISVTVPALDGEKAFFAHHEEMAIALQPGKMRIHLTDDTYMEAIISEGLADCANNRVNVLAFTIEKPEDYDALMIRQKEEMEEEKLRQKQSMLEYEMSKKQMAGAMQKLAHAGDSRVSRTDI